MSASVFEPIRSLSFELPRLQGGIVQRSLRSMAKARRVLFDPVDHADTEKFLERELSQQARNECNKWEFDFFNEVPFNLNNNKGRYVWKPVTPPHAPKKLLQRQQDESFDNTELYHMLPEKTDAELVLPEVMHIDTTVCHDDKPTGVAVHELPKRQSKITDFMQSRKRTADFAFAKKTMSSSSSPAVPTKRTASQSS